MKVIKFMGNQRHVALLINSVSGAIEPAYLLPISSVSDEQAYQG
ncbi:hypothetical protein [Vibrio parahaemolyticus]|nr:hypothetical protein [Vibrio parahaemolyticus]